MSLAAATTLALGLQGCEACGLVSRPAPGTDEGSCPRCGNELSFRKSASIQRTWAFLVAAAICYVPANVLPVLTTITASGRDSDTIMEGVVLLWSPTGWPLSLIVLPVVHRGRARSTATIGLRTGFMARWIGLSGYAIAVVLLLAIGITPWVRLLFPLWILLLSLDTLVESVGRRRAEGDLPSSAE